MELPAAGVLLLASVEPARTIDAGMVRPAFVVTVDRVPVGQLVAVAEAADFRLVDPMTYHRPKGRDRDDPMVAAPTPELGRHIARREVVSHAELGTLAYPQVRKTPRAGKIARPERQVAFVIEIQAIFVRDEEKRIVLAYFVDEEAAVAQDDRVAGGDVEARSVRLPT